MQHPFIDTKPPAPKAAGSRWLSTFAALRYPHFRTLWITTGLVAGGVWFQQVTLGWLAYDLTRDPLHTAAVLGIRTFPLLLSPITGVIADRFDRRKVLLIDQGLVTALVFGFAVVLMLEAQRIWHLYVFALAFGFLWAANNPVRQTMVANTVPRELLMNATAMSSMAFNSMRAIGPAVGGFVIAFFGPGVNFLIQGLLFFVAFLMITRLQMPYYTGDRREARASSPLRNLADGFQHVIHDRTTLMTTAVTLAVSLTTFAVVFNQLPVYAAEVLDSDDGTYLGLLLMAMGWGGFLGTAIIATFSHVRHKGVLASVSFLASALCIVWVSQVTSLWLAALALTLQQLFAQVIMTTNMTIVHTLTPDNLRGRVMGVYQMEIGMMPFGGLLAGAIASTFGVDQAFLYSGIAGVVLIALITLILPRYRRLEV